MSASNRRENIIFPSQWASDRDSQQDTNSCGSPCLRNSDQECPQIKKSYASPVFLGAIGIALIGAVAMAYSANVTRDATLRSGHEMAEATRYSADKAAQATRYSAETAAQATRDAASMTASGNTLAYAPQGAIPFQDPVPGQAFNLVYGMHLAFPVRGATYVISPVFNNTTTLRVTSGSFLLTVDKTQRFVCNAGDTIRLFWNRNPDFTLKALQKGTEAVVDDVQAGNHLGMTDCSNAEET